MKWDRLLEWMTHVGSGPWSAFRDAVAELDEGAALEEEPILFRSLRIALSDLGHVDFFVNGSRRWQVRRPALVGLAGSSTEHVFAGGRTSTLTSSLAEAATDAGAIVTIGEIRPGLSRIHIEGNPATLCRTAESLQIQYLPNAAAELTSRIPPLLHTLKTAAPATEPINWAVRSWSFKDAKWVPERLDRTVREYNNRHGVRRYLVGLGRRQGYREIEKRASIYCAALLRSERIVRYSCRDRSLCVPLWAPLPEGHARAACLAGGALAVVEGGQLVFKNLDPRIASALLVSLGQGFPMPEASP